MAKTKKQKKSLRFASYTEGYFGKNNTIAINIRIKDKRVENRKREQFRSKQP